MRERSHFLFNKNYSYILQLANVLSPLISLTCGRLSAYTDFDIVTNLLLSSRIYLLNHNTKSTPSSTKYGPSPTDLFFHWNFTNRPFLTLLWKSHGCLIEHVFPLGLHLTVILISMQPRHHNTFRHQETLT